MLTKYKFKLCYIMMPRFQNSFNVMQRVIVCILLLQCLQVTVHSQNEPATKPITFSCVIWKKLSFPELYYKQGKDYIELELLPNNRSDVYRLKGMSALELYVPDVDEAGRPVYKLVAQSPLQPNVRRLLFFIVESNSTTGLPLRVLGIDDSMKGFPLGHTRFVNMSTLSLKVGFGGEVTDLAAKSMCTVESNVSKNGGLMPFLVTDEKGNKVYQTRLMSQPRGRDMVFILPPNRPKGRVGVKFLPQVIPVKRSTDRSAALN